MSYCTNCRAEVLPNSTICVSCQFDPFVAHEDMSKDHLLGMKTDHTKEDIEYPGERTSFAFALIVSLVICAVFSLFTLGTFILVMAVSILLIRIREIQSRRSHVPVSENYFPKIYHLGLVAAHRLGIEPPPIYIIRQDELNAYTSGFWGEHWIIVYERVVEIMTPLELLFILGHEMGHISREHVTWQVVLSPSRGISVPFLKDILHAVFNSWSLKAEYSADRAGLIVTRDLQSCVTALAKLIAVDGKMDIGKYLEDFRKMSNGSLASILEYLSDHPYTANRILKLRAFSGAAIA